MKQFFNSPEIQISMFDMENIVTNASVTAEALAKNDIKDVIGDKQPIVIDLMSFR